VTVQQWQARLEVAVEGVGRGDSLARYFKTFKNLRHIVGPHEAVLRPGQNYQHIRLGGPFEAYGWHLGPARSLLVVATDTPGVRYALSTDPQNQNTLSTPQLLWNFSETIHSADFGANPTPSYDADGEPSWLNHTGAVDAGGGAHSLRFSLLTDSAAYVRYGGNTGKGSRYLGDGSVSDSVECRIVWGADYKKDLGQPNDALRFGYWLNCTSAPNGGSRLSFASHPFLRGVTNEEGLSATSGTPLDSEYVNRLIQGNMQITPHYTNTIGISADDLARWQWVEHAKCDFTHQSGANPDDEVDWSRITLASVSGLGDTYHEMMFGPCVVFTEASPLRHVETVVAETVDWRTKYAPHTNLDRSAATLTLMSPPGVTARVKYFLGVQ
jgi:hypothetical protein